MPEKKTDEVRTLKKSTCPSLSNRSELTYEFGIQDKAMMFRIAENSGEGHFSSAWIPLDAILALLDKAKDPFSLSIFKSLYPEQSINNTGFLGAALKKEGLIVIDKRKYLKKDTEAFLADLKKLASAPLKNRPSRKTAKTATKEVPK